ncbi:hypothetical protein [Nonomuraea dietziae]|uniref:hypothetical protein n=1 Tax=Nonomuraea dietziae TaxID=65515 RepID=UPI0031DA4740
MRLLVPPLAVAVALTGLLAATNTTAAAADRGSKPSYRLDCDGNGPGSTCTVVATGKAPASPRRRVRHHRQERRPGMGARHPVHA